MSIFFGGDVAYNKAAERLVSKITLFKPDLILIGGDIAYDNGNIHCYYSWDLMLWEFEKGFS